MAPKVKNLAPSMTVPEFARRYRMGQDKVRIFIQRGEILAVNTAMNEKKRPRWVIPPEALEQFEITRGTKARIETPRPAQKRAPVSDNVIKFF